MTSRTPSVSIGMPVRNGLPFLSEAIDSLLAQTYCDWELIISDNASDDGTAEICAEYARRDSRIRLLRNSENVGAAENYNRVCREARGRYFKWATADDICLPCFLDRCVAVLENDPNTVLCYPKAQFIDERGSQLDDFEDNMHVDHPSTVWRFRYVICNFIWGNCIFGVIRTDAIRRTNLIGAYPTADAVLAAELAMQGQFCQVPERLFLRRLHKGQSGRVHKTLPEVALWYHPSHARGRLFPRWRFLGEHSRAVRRSPLPHITRIACYFQLVHLVRRCRRSLIEEAFHGCRLLPRILKRWPPRGNGLSAPCGDRATEK